jgi:citrate lyase subunit beta/citryl-CoA lyase
MEPRTYLFVPGNRPERFAKALASGADAVVLDLEDAVAPAARGQARDAIARWSHEATAADLTRVVVRINEVQSSPHDDDLRLLRDARLTNVMLPKAESAAQVQAVEAAVPGAQVLALVESAHGVVNASSRQPGATQLVFGTGLRLDLDLDVAENAEGLSHAASALALASRVAGLPAPVAGVTPQLDDEPRLLPIWRGLAAGFGAKLCIHPRQVAPIRCARAQRRPSIGPGGCSRPRLHRQVAQLDGRMIDRPVVLQAQRTLQRAGV